ncbi:MAG: IPT/TIG domain-containing protein, partial [Planctomycetota bacterium]|nr:IPT/TIG domain-containing protein [Planctomycetota bacterium]
CGGEDEVTAPAPPTATALLVVSGDAQTGTVDQSLPSALVVQVNDQSGNPMAGIGVTFAVAAGGGSVATASATTGQDGQASTTWTLGTMAGGNHQVTAAATGVSSSVTFAATADPDAGRVISAVSGDGQNAFRGTKVPLPIVVLVRDQFANPVTGHLVAFVAQANSGTLDSAVAFTNVIGEARTGWTLSSTVGVNTAEAQSAGLTGDPVTFMATAHNLSITSVSPTPLLEGQAATIIGTGFEAVPAQNVVTVGGVSATVTAATTTQLDITVPTACIPAGTLDVQVTAGGLTSAPFSESFTPANILAMAAGEQVIVQDPTAFCFQFAAASNTETYLIGIQSVTEVASTRTPVTLTSVVASGAAPAPPVAALASRVAGRVAVDPEVARRAALLSRYRAMERRLLQRELETVHPMARPLRMAQARRVVPPDVMVGDVIAINVPGVTTGTCNDFTPITTVVRTVGTRAVWLEDQGNPAGGYSTADIDAFSTQFDNVTYGTNVAYFGADTDVDANTRVVVVLTQEVNKLGSAGQVFLRDFNDPASCPASNGGEFFYVWVPDPNGTAGDPISLDLVREFDPAVFAHEFAHTIQLGRRIQAGNPMMTLWEIEGQATLAEEVVGHAVEGHAPGQNLRGSVAYDLNQTATSRFWYSGGFLDMGVYYGADFLTASPRKVNGAPHDCTWLDIDNKGVCARDIEHGVSWAFLRWLSDHYGSSFAGGEQEFHRAIIDNTVSGFANLAGLVGVPIETLLAQWAAMLYVDDRVLVDGTVVVPVDPKLTMTSWNLFSVFEGIVFNIGGMMFQVHLLEPAVRGFQDFTESFNVRAASTGYFLVSGTGRPATAIRARGVSDGVLPSAMQYWVVRLQ